VFAGGGFGSGLTTDEVIERPADDGDVLGQITQPGAEGVDRAVRQVEAVPERLQAVGDLVQRAEVEATEEVPQPGDALDGVAEGLEALAEAADEWRRRRRSVR
jgi:hypothetical protein